MQSFKAVAATARYGGKDRPIGIIPMSWILSVLMVSTVAVALMIEWTGLGVAASLSIKLVMVICLLVNVAVLYYCHAPRAEWQRVMRDTAEYASLLVAVSLLGTVSTYPAAAHSLGYADAALQQADVMLGLDWLDWYNFVAAHPVVQVLERTAYHCIYLSPAILLGYFALTNRKAEARLFIAAFWLAALITVLLFMLVPAVGPLAYLTGGRITYVPASALDQSQMIPALQSHRLHFINVGTLSGLVSAPSFHAASATLFVAIAWPFRALRWPMLAINAAMLLATPVEGTHYFVDIIAGIVVAAAALTAMHAFARRCTPAAARESGMPGIGRVGALR